MFAVVGSPLLEFLKRLDVPPSGYERVSNGTFLPNQAVRPAVFPVTQDVVRFCSVSNLIPLKGIADNIRALSLIKHDHGIDSWHYSIIGDGPERKFLARLSKELRVDQHVSILGRLNRSETLAQIADCDVFSMPSWGDAFGIVYIEALARGKLVFGCESSGAKDIISHNYSGILVPKKDPEALADQFKRIWQDPTAMTDIAARGLVVSSEFSWTFNVDKILQLLRRNPDVERC